MTRCTFGLQWTTFAFLLTLAALPTLAKDDDDKNTSGGWLELGDTQITDHDADNRVAFKSDDRAVTHIRLRVGQKTTRINSIIVAFDGGNTQTIQVGETLQPGDMTKPYNLKGDKRRIERITINAAVAKKEEGKAKLIVYGKKG